MTREEKGEGEEGGRKGSDRGGGGKEGERIKDREEEGGKEGSADEYEGEREHIYMCVFVCVYTYMYACVCVCMRVYITHNIPHPRRLEAIWRMECPLVRVKGVRAGVTRVRVVCVIVVECS